MRVGFGFHTSFTSRVIPIIGWPQFLSRILQGYRVYKAMEYFKGLDCIAFKIVKELAVLIESIEGLEILVYRVSRVFQTTFRIGYIRIGVMLLFTS